MMMMIGDRETFVDLLTYLYTMHASIEDHDGIGLIALVRQHQFDLYLSFIFMSRLHRRIE